MAKYTRCKICNRFFTLGSYNKEYCSKKCAAKKRYYIKKPKVKKVCKRCGKEFSSNRINQLYCVEKCRLSDHNTYVIKNKSCLYCGEQFSTTTDNRKYCSDECATLTKSKRDRELYSESCKG